MKYSIARRHLFSTNFEEKLNKLCDIAHVNVEEEIRSKNNPEWKIDLDFLNGQRETPQRGVMIGIDMKLAAQEKEKKMQRRRSRIKENQRKTETAIKDLTNCQTRCRGS